MLSKRCARLGVLVAVPVLLLLMGFRQAPLIDPPPIAVPASVSETAVASIVEQAMAKRGWRLVKKTPGEIDAVYDPRDFSVTIAAHYNAHQVQINYVTSDHLKYKVKHGVRYIHKNYISWIKNLVTDIQNRLVMAE